MCFFWPRSKKVIEMAFIVLKDGRGWDENGVADKRCIHIVSANENFGF